LALRKMLGSADHPAVRRMMQLMETQSHRTLTRFALEAAARYLPIVQAHVPGETRPAAALEAVRAYLDGAPLAPVKTAVRDARAAAQALAANPVAQAAARAVATACATATTPTCALGFTFYGAAAIAYHSAGVDADRAAHDDLATRELDALCAAFGAMCIPDEPAPVRLDWGC
jgi:hypothetical protein